MHLGLDADAEVNGETTQFAACASGRLSCSFRDGRSLEHIIRDLIEFLCC